MSVVDCGEQLVGFGVVGGEENTAKGRRVEGSSQHGT